MQLSALSLAEEIVTELAWRKVNKGFNKWKEGGY